MSIASVDLRIVFRIAAVRGRAEDHVQGIVFDSGEMHFIRAKLA